MSKEKKLIIAKKPGRPRSKRAQQAILTSAYALLQEKGFSRVTVEAVAMRAKVGKPTIYRYWANAQELAMAAVLANPGEEANKYQQKSPLANLRSQVNSVVDRFSTPTGRQITLMMAASEKEGELAKAFRNQIILKSREEGRSMVLNAIEAGEIKKEVPVDTVLDMIYGPIFYRLLAGHAPVTRTFATELIDMVLCGIGNL